MIIITLKNIDNKDVTPKLMACNIYKQHYRFFVY